MKRRRHDREGDEESENYDDRLAQKAERKRHVFPIRITPAGADSSWKRLLLWSLHTASSEK